MAHATLNAPLDDPDHKSHASSAGVARSQRQRLDSSPGVCSRALDLEPLPCVVLKLSRYCRHSEQAVLALPWRDAHCDTLVGSMMTDPQFDILSTAVGGPNPVLIEIRVAL